MANVKVRWVLPTVRQSGRPLDISQIAGAEIAISADAGATFSVDGVYPPDVTETVFSELEAGDWLFRCVVIDTAGRRSNPALGGITIADESPPGEPVIEVTLA